MLRDHLDHYKALCIVIRRCLYGFPGVFVKLSHS